MACLRILGFDAAWTTKNPSGLALVDYVKGRRPTLVWVGRSFAEIGQTPVWSAKAHLGSAGMLARIGRVDIAVVDMPLSAKRIVRRRPSDDAISRQYSGRGAGTHSPSPDRPGKQAAIVFDALRALGLSFAAAGATVRTGCFLETYPHPAIIELIGLDYRLPYKVARRWAYTKDHVGLMSIDRFRFVAEKLGELRAALGQRIHGVSALVPDPLTILEKPGMAPGLKAIEDVLDAVVCAWVGVEFASDRAIAFGDHHSAIWLPKAGAGLLRTE
ncbi:MAG: hypothetical protein A2V88_12245 [Elusimicrobia bacterium RBG_16_66_12]|nr:MAG: hypothetical protein A2V88_12245 [Elusimicrobia bacterium RBG_16_66_12]